MLPYALASIDLGLRLGEPLDKNNNRWRCTILTYQKATISFAIKYFYLESDVCHIILLYHTILNH